MITNTTRIIALLMLLQITLPAAAEDKSAVLMVQELESLNQFSAYGRQLYQDDVDKRKGLEYCSVSLQFAEEGEFRYALREASKTIYLGKENSKSYVVGVGTRNLAMAYSYANDLVNAERLAKIALDEYGSEGPAVMAPVYKVLGDVRMRQARYAEATDFYNKGLGWSQTWMEPMFLASLARSYALTKQFDKASEYYDKATEQAENLPPNNRSNGIVGTFGKPGAWMEPTLLRGKAELAYLQGNYDKAIMLYDAVKQAAGEDAYQDVWIYTGKARALWAKGDKPAALSAIEQAVARAEAMRAQFRSEEIKIGLFSNVQDVFDEAIDMYMAEGKSEQALLISEKSRARALLDMVRNRVSLSNGTDAFADPMRKVASLKDIQATVPAKSALVVYHSNPKRTYVWVIRKDGVKSVTLEKGRSGLANMVRQLQQQIRQRGDTNTPTKELYQLLIAPLALKKNESIIIVPHKALHFLPFQALQGPGGYLIEAHQLRQIPSASMLALKKNSTTGKAGLLALGNPKLASPEYDLPGAQAEVEAIAKLYPAPKVFLREKATRSRVLEDGPGSQIIHIAAHAEVDEIDPLRSRILLSPDAIDNKRDDLEANDIYQIDLHNTALVVLSACRSGLGSVTGGDEIFGFTRTFISAGADQVMVSLWDVEDKSTATLMQDFYKTAQKSDMAAALQHAQLAVLKNPEYREPLFWAGFNLIGTP